jgi:exodeoxyribonuclease V alpha subunit
LRVRLVGHWGHHATHGRQFEFDVCETLSPEGAEGLTRYLASDAFDGVGEVLAKRIVEALGPQALERIRDEPSCLEGIQGLRPGIREKLVAQVGQELGAHRVHSFLRGLGLGPGQAGAIIRKLGTDCEARIRRDPYVLVSGIPGIGFATADQVAGELKIADDDPRRLRAGLQAALGAAASDGHSLLPQSELFGRAAKLLARTEGAVTPDSFEGTLGELERERELIVELPGFLGDTEDGEPDIYLPWLATSEVGLAHNLATLLQQPAHALAGPDELAAAEERTGWTLDTHQREAVLGLLASPVALLTGGPGVGKTTIVNLVVALARGTGARVSLASPTGRAAKRLAEATGHEAQTVHRLLGYEPRRGSFERGGFAHDDKSPLEADLVVVDEISMLDVALAHHLVKAIRPPTRLVLVGDPNQLPSVGPGSVLVDIIASKTVPVFRLSRIYRQAERSLIVENAHRILQGELPTLPQRGDREADFYLFPAEGPGPTADRLVEVVTRRIPETFGFDWASDVQVIAPMYRGDCGVDALNERLREAVGTGGREVRQGARIWRLGDRVIHTRNDYDKEVFNGDMGRIAAVDEDGTVTVRYPERDVVYTKTELGNLQAAFAITVHRSQGGEFPVVAIPLVTQHFMMLQRHLLYTAVTRARKLVVLVGSERALRMALENADQNLRRSRLAERLQREVGS